MPPCSAPTCWWQMQASGLLSSGSCSQVCNLWVLFIFSSWLCCPLRFQNPHRPASERVSWCFETSPLLRHPPWDGSPSLILLSISLSFIFCPISFQREWAAFLGACCPLPAFRSCFVVFAQCSKDLSMNLWERKWSPRPIPPPSQDCPPHFNYVKLRIFFFLI